MNNTNKKIFKYKELLPIISSENYDPIVSLNSYCPDILSVYEKKDMIHISGNDIYIRKTVAEKLCLINKKIKLKNPNLCLKVTYGYRHPDIQKRYFDKKMEEIKIINPNLSEEELKGATHNFVAVPEVAGHPTGGAVDITMAKSNKDIDMGTGIADYSDEDKIKTYSSKITKKQMENRMILHDLMISEGFAPFYGEWWHFSYGDREWALFYKKKQSIYSPIIYKK